jgi:AbrB family looped-hinge helix DNA binding protein
MLERQGMAKPLIEVVKLGRRGEIVLPRRVRSTLNLHEGDDLVLRVDDKRVVLERRARQFSTYLDVMAEAEAAEKEDRD